MDSPRIDLAAETGSTRVFVWAPEWPGWCRSGKNQEAAIESLRMAGRRYLPVAITAGLAFPDAGVANFRVVEQVSGGGATDFGVPSTITNGDRRAVDAREAKRLASLVAAAWQAFDQVAADAPEELRKGPRGGGRDTSKVIGHVNEADHAYARQIGLKIRLPSDPDAVAAMRREVLAVLGQSSDGSPLADRKWPLRYAARRIAWHALDHAWEIEDRTP